MAFAIPLNFTLPSEVRPGRTHDPIHQGMNPRFEEVKTMHKTLLPLLLISLLAACGKQEATSAAPAAPAPAVAAAPAVVENHPGEGPYKQVCALCHGGGVAGAPKTGDKAAWAPRIAQGNDTLYKHAIEGFTGQAGMMPPKGGGTGLSDEQVKLAVDFMVAKAQ